MSKIKAVYVCTECNTETSRWQGQCFSCGSWNTLEEHIQNNSKSSKLQSKSGFTGKLTKATVLSDVSDHEVYRVPTNIKEFDRVLGGGIVKGSVILVGGEPGIGKSSILLQIMAYLSQTKEVLYISGEESIEQISIRAKRLDLSVNKLHVMCETNVDLISEYLISQKPEIVVVDSIQTIYNPDLSSMVGGVSQVRETSAYLTQIAKQHNIAIFLVGHVTKSGEVAGPRVLEHIVDTVVFIEPQDNGRYRMMRALKNRFGAANEIGVFAMTDKGMKEVKNPSAIFLNNGRTNLIGSAIVTIWEGTRPMLVELQSLVTNKNIDQAPKRLAVGFDTNRVSMLLAVAQRYLGLNLYDKDIFINVVGGIKIIETSIDLALLSIVYSSILNIEIPSNMIIMGEVGLSGEVRPIPYGLERINEAIKHGYKKLVIPKGNVSNMLKTKNVDIIGIDNISKLKEIIG